MKKIIYALSFAFLMQSSNIFAQTERSEAFHAKYKLSEVAIFSRHNVRSPITSENSMLGAITPHKWIEWSSDQSHLTLKGGVLETENGQFFRKWTVSEGLFKENAMPTEDEVLFYANSKQRTIATARYFLTGFLPVSDLHVTWKGQFDSDNPDFNQKQYNITDSLRNQVQKELIEKYGVGGLRKLSENVAPGLKLIQEVLDLEESKAYKDGTVTDFTDHDMQFSLVEGKEPTLSGSVEVAADPGDALILQYYESLDSIAAAFGHNLTREQWHTLATVKDLENELRFSIPCIYKPLAQVFLSRISEQLKNPSRKFFFMCGHDTNVMSILNALDVEDYTVDNSVEVHVPVGSKIVFEKWEDADGKQYIAVNHVYQSVDQIRNCEQLSLSNPPMIKSLRIKALKANEDGLYPFNEFINYIDNINTTTSVSEVKSQVEAKSDSIYNLQGVKINSKAKGIVVRNNKKYIQK